MVVFPEPVGPVVRTIPWGRSAHRVSVARSSGRANPALGHEDLSQSHRLDYVLGVDTTMDMRDDADLYVTEEEARLAYEAEFRRARQALRLDYLAPPNAPDVQAMRVAE